MRVSLTIGESPCRHREGTTQCPINAIRPPVGWKQVTWEPRRRHDRSWCWYHATGSVRQPAQSVDGELEAERSIWATCILRCILFCDVQRCDRFPCSSTQSGEQRCLRKLLCYRRARQKSSYRTGSAMAMYKISQYSMGIVGATYLLRQTGGCGMHVRAQRNRGTV
ncbi:hypothetical protein BD413DRAFT_25409 [Trametes elegans]|nr:hypothetical protein BD413DRAFT_25409 [Trametes elegans]